jgi:hypothetical protein
VTRDSWRGLELISKRALFGRLIKLNAARKGKQQLLRPVPRDKVVKRKQHLSRNPIKPNYRHPMDQQFGVLRNDGFILIKEGNLAGRDHPMRVVVRNLSEPGSQDDTFHTVAFAWETESPLRYADLIFSPLGILGCQSYALDLWMPGFPVQFRRPMGS